MANGISLGDVQPDPDAPIGGWELYGKALAKVNEGEAEKSLHQAFKAAGGVANLDMGKRHGRTTVKDNYVRLTNKFAVPVIHRFLSDPTAAKEDKKWAIEQLHKYGIGTTEEVRIIAQQEYGDWALRAFEAACQDLPDYHARGDVFVREIQRMMQGEASGDIIEGEMVSGTPRETEEEQGRTAEEQETVESEAGDTEAATVFGERDENP